MPAKRDKSLVIVHKKSSQRPEVRAAVKAVRKSGIDLDARVPWNQKDLRRIVKEARRDGVSRIIAGGGDGTINKVVNALMRRKDRKDIVMGVMPLGTANDFARGNNIPLDDLEAALRLACTAAPRSVDVGRANKDYFVNVASGGFGADVTASTPENMKRNLGGAAYTLMGLAKAITLEPYTGRLILPDGEVNPGRMLIMAVGNSRYAGGGFDVAPKADLNDGLLDLAVASPWDEGEMGTMISELDDPMNPANKYLRYWQLPAFTIESDRPLNINLDGQPVLNDRFEFEAIPSALTMALG